MKKTNKLISLVTLGLVILFIGSVAAEPKSGSNASLGRLSTGSFVGNRIHDDLENNGMIVSHRLTGHSGMEWPAGSHNYSNFASGVWFAGKVNDGIRTAVGEYGPEFSSGPFGADADGTDKLFIVNKSDLDGAGQLFQAVQDFIGSVEKNPIILKVSSKTGKGMTEFVKELNISMKKKKKGKKQKENDMLAIELNDIILNTINQKISSMITSSKSYSTYLKKVQGKKIDPFEASDKISKELLRK